tara:strand:- start:819 stop:1082 length:264 start_codon:yes stop_codon:yes gene_type:complete
MKNYREFLGWSGCVLAILGIALCMLGSTLDGEVVQWLGVIVGAISCVFLVYYSITRPDEPKKIVHNLYSKDEWDEIEETYLKDITKF